MESLRLAQRKVFQQLFHELSTRQTLSRNQQLLRQPQRLRTVAKRNFSSSQGRSTTFGLQSNIRRPQAQLHSASPFRTSRTIRQSKRPYSSSASAEQEPTSISARFKKLSREYGWSALGVYFLLSALDFPLCFLAVRTLGTDRIAHWEHVAVEFLKDSLQWPMEKLGWEMGQNGINQGGKIIDQGIKNGLDKPEEQGESRVLDDKSYANAKDTKSDEGASIWTQLALAYAVHKSLIFFRVPLTAAITPQVVKTFRAWGFDIGKRAPAAVASSTSKTGITAQKGTGINTGSK